jgi:hypothetical protein
VEAVLEARLYKELALTREWFPWKVEALVAAGVLTAEEGDEWTRWAATIEPAAPEVLARAARLDLDRARATELYKAGLVSARQLRAAIEREEPSAERLGEVPPDLGDARTVICPPRAVMGGVRILAVVLHERGVVAHPDGGAGLALVDDVGTEYRPVHWNMWAPAVAPEATRLELFNEDASVQVAIPR